MSCARASLTRFPARSGDVDRLAVERLGARVVAADLDGGREDRLEGVEQEGEVAGRRGRSRAPRRRGGRSRRRGAGRGASSRARWPPWPGPAGRRRAAAIAIARRRRGSARSRSPRSRWWRPRTYRANPRSARSPSGSSRSIARSASRRVSGAPSSQVSALAIEASTRPDVRRAPASARTARAPRSRRRRRRGRSRSRRTPSRRTPRAARARRRPARSAIPGRGPSGASGPPRAAARGVASARPAVRVQRKASRSMAGRSPFVSPRSSSQWSAWRWCVASSSAISSRRSPACASAQRAVATCLAARSDFGSDS